MKRKNASLLGNVLMGLGLVVMVVGVGYSILNQLPQFNMPQYFAHGAVLSIFVGAILWLAGAVQNGKLAASIPALVSALNRVDFPTLGKPTIPHLNPMI